MRPSTPRQNTFASMLVRLEHRYEGDIAFSNDPDNLDSISLIGPTRQCCGGGELSIDGAPPATIRQSSAPSSTWPRIADFYTLLSNEAYADTQVHRRHHQRRHRLAGADVFSFQNQVDSLLAGARCLLRGRDETNASVHAPPVYDRLF